jgi:hypothetical protein
MRSTRGVLLFSALLLVGLALAVQAATPELCQWLPGESYAGGKQADPRLDKPVSFWNAGLPLASIFRKVKEQTGVSIGFYPPGDANERICVNLYLSPRQPIQLRSLLAQLAWVTDCSFATEGEAEQRTYTLLSTSIGSGAYSSYLTHREADMRARYGGGLADLETSEKMPARLAEVREAMGLSREELIERCRGKDDLLLLALLDPERRALCRYLLTLPHPPDPRTRAMDQRAGVWSGLTSEQREPLREILAPQLRDWGRENRPNAGDWNDWAWVEKRLANARLSYRLGGYQLDVVIRDDEDPADLSGTGFVAAWVQLLDIPALPPTSRASLDIELRRLLGETISEEDQRRLIEEATRNAERARAQSYLRQARQLSPEAEARLSSTRLPVEPKRAYPLWQLQEAAAMATGLSIISDCFLQPERALPPVLGLLYGKTSDPPSALEVLSAACLPTRDIQGQLYWANWAGTVAWDWGSAGEILRFRSTERGLWRAAQLPQAARAAMDGWLAPHLKAIGQGTPPTQITEALDPRRYGAVVSQLQPAQLRWGGSCIYGDPTDLRGAYYHAAREKLLEVLQEHAYHCQILSSLSDTEWRHLQGEGLVWGRDLEVEPAPTIEPATYEEFRKGDRLRLVPGGKEPPEHKLPTGVPRFPSVCLYTERATANGPGPWSRYLPTKLPVTPKSTDSGLVTRGAERP